jgi:L-iditol 2-dehydrogenase
MQALVKYAAEPGNIELRDIPEPTLESDEVLIEIYGSGICGSDLHFYHNTWRMTPLKYPLFLGHEYAGTIIAVGNGVTEWKVGDRVTAETSAGCENCDYCRIGYTNICPNRYGIAGAFTNRLKVKARYVYKLPDNLDLQTATLIEPLACIVHGVIEDTPVLAGDVCAVIGPGPFGILAALVAQAQGATVVLIGRETSKMRLEVARDLGIKYVVNSSKEDPLKLIQKLTNGYGADVAFGCAGTGAAVEFGIEAVKKRGYYTELALFESRIELDFERVLFKEVKVTGAVAHRRPAWQRTIRLIEEEILPPQILSKVITGVYPLSEWKTAFDSATNKQDVKVIIRPDLS